MPHSTRDDPLSLWERARVRASHVGDALEESDVVPDHRRWPFRIVMLTMTTARPLTPMRWGSLPELVGPRHVYRVRRLAALFRQAVPGGRVLDAGCGAGTLTEILARAGYRVTAVDASPEFVEYVDRRMRDAGLADRVTVERGSLGETPLPSAAFDGVVSGEVLEHLPDDGAAVRSMAASLRTGGALAVSVPAGASQYDWLDEWAGHARRYEEADLRALLTGAGLEVERIIRWGFPFMALYERLVQRPGLRRTADAGPAGSRAARLARHPAICAAAGALFGVDRLFEGRVNLGTGFLAVARKP